MKQILVACDQSQMDMPLRRSLAHLVKSCDITVVHNGYTAFEEIGAHPFDLLVIDFKLSGIDSLELVESVQYIDPGVPVILMLPQEYQSIRDTSLGFGVQSITCPFKPLKFLRLVDRLLHQQLNRYRQLAGMLETALETLRAKTNTPCAFLVKNDGQLLLANGNIRGEMLESLGNLAVGVSVLDEELKRLFAQDQTLRANYGQAQQNHGLYVVPATKRLSLALLSSLTDETWNADAIWQSLNETADNVRQAFEHYHQNAADSSLATGSPDILAQDHVFIPLSLEIEAALSEVGPVSEQDEIEETEDEVAVNWEIISSSSSLLSRLHNLTRSD
ncbi:MAG: response regulator [Anaerolineae bacterium]|nr:response regulator [Anaerolineae bacterium]